jgi:hypothetical protein
MRTACAAGVPRLASWPARGRHAEARMKVLEERAEGRRGDARQAQDRLWNPREQSFFGSPNGWVRAFANDFEISSEGRLMGGFGSGRPARWPSLWSLYSVRTSQIRVACGFRPGLVGSITFGDGTVIAVRTSPGYVHVNDVPILLDWTEPHLGGRRAWFRCCYCGRRCTFVYGRQRQWGCRCCWRANYPSQKEAAFDRLIRRAAGGRPLRPRHRRRLLRREHVLPRHRRQQSRLGRARRPPQDRRLHAARHPVRQRPPQQFGIEEISRTAYKARLKAALAGEAALPTQPG